MVCRTSKPIPKTEKRKNWLFFCSVPKDAVVECRDMKTIYEVPLALEAQGECVLYVLKMLGMEDRTPDLNSWEGLVKNIKNPEKAVKSCNCR